MSSQFDPNDSSMRTYSLYFVAAIALLLIVLVSGDTIKSNEGVTAPSSNPNGEELVARMKVGTRVTRGVDWKWENETDARGEVNGTVIEPVIDGWVKVRWDNGHTNSYRMGKWNNEEKYDLQLADVPKMSGKQIADLLEVGSTVIRGPNWKWDDQDGGIGKTGIVIEANHDDWVKVKWENGNIFKYRAGIYGCDVTSPHLDEALRSHIKRLSRVVRGRDWKWGTQDGGTGTLGTVVREDEHGWVRVDWDQGGSNSYRMGYNSKYDLFLAESQILPNRVH